LFVLQIPIEWGRNYLMANFDPVVRGQTDAPRLTDQRIILLLRYGGVAYPGLRTKARTRGGWPIQARCWLEWGSW